MAKDLGVKTTDSDDFYFLSYNSEDAWRVASYAKKLVDANIGVWYDNSLAYGQDWEDRIGKRIGASKGLILFFTQGIIEKENSYVVKEFEISKLLDKEIFIIYIDKLNEKENCTKFPGISHFIVDLSKTHSPQNIDELISYLKDPKSENKKENNKKSEDSLSEIKGPTIFDSKYLIDNKMITTEKLSERHVKLDELVVDAEKYPEAIEAEQDADYWVGMTSDTSDCCANLIVNGEIVGYMDFIPVDRKDYIALQTETFTQDYVAFYTGGGKFDIFVSMLSVERNFAGQTYLLLFIKWMVEKILMWKKQSIFIGKIEFCIYSQHQAKILESIGAKHILTSKLKGMMYEIKVEDLLNGNLYQLKNVEPYYEYKLITDKDVSLIKQCKKIALSLHTSRGGILQYENAVNDSDFIFIARKEDEIIGYICLKKYDVFENSLYIEQIAVKKEYQDLGVGRHLLLESLKFASDKDYDEIIANCKKINRASFNLFKTLGFSTFTMSNEIYKAIGIDESDIKKNYALRKDL